MKSIPAEWMPYQTDRLLVDGLSIRFHQKTEDALKRLARFHGVSTAEVVRILVHRSLAELERDSAA